MRFALLVLFLSGIQIATQQATAKIRQYQEVMNLDPQTISANCQEVKKYYELSIEAYDFLQSFTVEAMEETLQNIGKLRTLGQQLEGEATATFEQQALREQLDETRNERRLQELEWRVNWSNNAESSDVSAEEISAMKEEISSISGEKQKELDQLIQQKTVEQSQIIEQIQLGETSYNKLNADKQDVNAAIIVLNDKLESNKQQINETLEGNSTKGEKLNGLLLQLEFFERQKKSAISFESIKQLSQLSMKTQDEIAQINEEIEQCNNNISILEESNKQIKDNLITKDSQMKEIELQLERVSSELIERKHQSSEVTTLLERSKSEYETLLSQVVQPASFLQTGQELTEKQKELERAEAKVREGKEKVERLEREERMYQQSSMDAQQSVNELTQRLISVTEEGERQQLEEKLEATKKKQQAAYDNYIQKKEELVKQKQLLVTFENFETSIQNDELKEEQKQIEQKKEEQQQRENEIEEKTKELSEKLRLKEEEKGEACAIPLQPVAEEVVPQKKEEEEAPLIIPTSEVPQPKERVRVPTRLFNETVSEENKTVIPAPPLLGAPNIQPPRIEEEEEIREEEPVEEEEEIIEPEAEAPAPKYTSSVIKPKEEKVVLIPPEISPENEEALEKAEESVKKKKVVNEVKELIRNLEELIEIKEQEVEEKLKVVIEKEEIVLKHETEIQEASQRIKEEVVQCKQQKREIIKEARTEREEVRSKVAEQAVRAELERLNTELKEEFRKEAEVTKKKKAVEEKQEEVREKQAEIDKQVERIEERMFKDVPKVKQTETIRVDKGMSPPPQSKAPLQQVPGSSIPLAYPWEERKFEYKEEIIKPKEEEKEIVEEEVRIKQQEQKAEVEQQVVEEQKEVIKQEEKQVELKEYQIQQKEQQFEEKKQEVVREITKLDEEIEKCKIVFGRGEEQSDEFQMCQQQSTDYEAKKHQLEQMRGQYEQELGEFNKQKSEFYSKLQQSNNNNNNYGASFVEIQREVAVDFANHLEKLAKLRNTNARSLKKSIRHKEGIQQLMLAVNSLSANLQTVFLSIQQNNNNNNNNNGNIQVNEIKSTLKQVVDEINSLYETAIIQRNLKQGQNKLLEKKKVLMKMQGACLEAQRIIQQQQQ